MPAFALLTSDPNLLRCQVELLRPHLQPAGGARPKTLGLGYIEADNILLRKKPGDVGSSDLRDLTADVISEVLFFHEGLVGMGAFADEDAMPLRFRRWMFMHQGELGSPGRVRLALFGELPDFLKRQIKGTTASEVCFLTLIKRLRDAGRTEDFDIPTPLVGRLLAETARRVEQAEREAGRLGNVGFFVTNGRLMAATRLGSATLHYALLEGIARCERCGITEATPDSNPLLRTHRRVRGVALATDLAPGARGGFIEVPEASVVTVAHNLEIQVAPLGALTQT